MTCILKLKQVYSDLTDVDRKIADYIQNNEEVVCKMRVSELAKECGASTASIVRFCRKIGYEGFAEFKIELAKHEGHRESEHEYESSYIDENSSLQCILNSVSEKNIQGIEQTIKLNKIEDIQTVVDYILEGKNVYIFGMSVSALIAQDLQMKLVRIGKSVITFLDPHTQVMSANNIGKDDIAIGISYSGERKEVVAALSKAKERGAKCIGITKFGESSITSISKLSLYVPNVEKNIRESAISSRIAMLTLVDSIFLGVVKGDFKGNEIKLIETRKLLESID